ncbi:hypothetical protein HOG17_00445 [Candidatus Peregrinibacteria bacterium]|jgi:hypothetical protein|nr:hypothetical protein [Candidatus Peregrinibacteria bacterium]MBT4147729.1 hypothetical protein [Candidatus Peregrinibacteria bacterium]MBT4366203.1 hypothetical protein [Candidatus Peregrinibacteria bacterium]MBT4455726.1 hypothetical protein [Candidatus Peregrinibacteria bacterium]
MKDPEYVGLSLTVDSPGDLEKLPDRFRFAEDLSLMHTANTPGVFITHDIPVEKVELGPDFLSVNVGGAILFLPHSALRFPFEVISVD